MSLDRARSIAEVSSTAGETVSDLLVQLKEKVVAAMDTSIDTSSRTALDSDFKSILRQITQTVQNAQFDGANLLDGSLPSNLKFLANADANSFITLSKQTLSLGGAIITIAATASLGTITQATNILGQLSTSISLTNQALGNLGSQQKQLEGHSTFVGKLTDVLNTGVGNLVDADLARKRASAGLAGAAAARRPGAVDRQLGAADHPVAVPRRLTPFRWGVTGAWRRRPGPFSLPLTSCQPLPRHDRAAGVCPRVGACPSPVSIRPFCSPCSSLALGSRRALPWARRPLG